MAGLLDLERAYWAVAAALLMLHRGFDWPRTLQRSLERTLGTWAGLLLAGAILWLHPSGPWLALLVAMLQFIIELVVVRNYAIAAIFITGAALTIASGGRPVDDVAGLLLTRGLDTLLGCACALLAFRLLPPRTDARTVAAGIGQCLFAIREVCAWLVRNDVTRPAARATRRDLQHHSFILDQAWTRRSPAPTPNVATRRHGGRRWRPASGWSTAYWEPAGTWNASFRTAPAAVQSPRHRRCRMRSGSMRPCKTRPTPWLGLQSPPCCRRCHHCWNRIWATCASSSCNCANARSLRRRPGLHRVDLGFSRFGLVLAEAAHPGLRKEFPGKVGGRRDPLPAGHHRATRETVELADLAQRETQVARQRGGRDAGEVAQVAVDADARISRQPRFEVPDATVVVLGGQRAGEPVRAHVRRPGQDLDHR
ncbi:FUSC family protein [Pseudoxanthomonas sp. NC8]|nr:FUSC family protein [Pseudoxanthomonas sp. NC8]